MHPLHLIHNFFSFFLKDEKCMVVYISFDPFSIINKKFSACSGFDGDEKRLKSVSISEAIIASTISLQSLYGFMSPPSSNIGDVLKHLQKQHQGQPVHFLVDEFNQEFITNQYALDLRKTLNECFKDSTVVIALQSVSKQRKICSATDNKDIIQQTTTTDFQSTGMKLFELKTAARMTNQLFKLQKNLEDKASTSLFKAALSFKGEFLYYLHFFCCSV